MYYVEIKTANAADAGTNSDIYVEFISKNGKKSKKTLLDNSGDDFERNSIGYYFIPGELDADDSLEAVNITHSGSDQWKIAGLKVSVGGRTWRAFANSLLENETKKFSLSISIGTANWMSTLPSQISVEQINIPGTHDSGTSYLNSANYHQTQSLNIAQQLLAGIRYFDLRLRCVVNPAWKTGQPEAQRANFSIHHDADWCYLFFDKDSWLTDADKAQTKGYVLQDILKFLKEYPSEFVLLQISREYNQEKYFNRYFKALIRRHDVENNFLLTDTYPTYQQAKGKIVILNANRALTNCGIPLSLPKFLDTPALFVENHWMDVNKETKWGKVEIALRQAMKEEKGQWVINFVSDGSGAMHPSEFAKYLNAWVEDFITKNNKMTLKHYGTVLFDYPTHSVIQKLLAKYLGK